MTLLFDDLIYLYSENVKTGYHCVGEVDGEKVFRIQYESKAYYVTQTYTHLYIIYNNNPDDYDIEVLDIETSNVIKHLNRITRQ